MFSLSCTAQSRHLGSYRSLAFFCLHAFPKRASRNALRVGGDDISVQNPSSDRGGASSGDRIDRNVALNHAVDFWEATRFTWPVPSLFAPKTLSTPLACRPAYGKPFTLLKKECAVTPWRRGAHRDPQPDRSPRSLCSPQFFLLWSSQVAISSRTRIRSMKTFEPS